MILRTLRTSSVAAIVERLHPLLHLDPVVVLPPEMTFQIFSYLSPQDLLVASVISRGWRARALDSRLWRRLYLREGWAAEKREVRRFERESLSSSPPSPSRSDADRKARMTRTAADGGDEEQRSKKRIPEDGLPLGRDDERTPFSAQTSFHASALGWMQQHGLIEADKMGSPEFRRPPFPAGESQDDVMRDVDIHAPGRASQSTLALSQSFNDTSLNSQRTTTAPVGLSGPIYPSQIDGTLMALDSPLPSLATITSPLRSNLTLPSSDGERKLNWQHIYKQRRRLEENWNAGRFVNFQLPHPDHPEEAHRECIYTIQYCGQYLVSGSRDRTIRIWHLDSKRLVRGPLVGHTGSVLCLQFDADEDEDTIISGSSDTDVIVWRFSTGEQIKKIRHAHRESVLNLKYDKRYLVTCSKDKTINVWSRRQLDATSEEFPIAVVGNAASAAVLPAYVVSMAFQPGIMAEGGLAQNVTLETLQPYSLLMSLRGHNAAVNAIQVLGDQVVSASGDRTIKMWDLRTGQCELTIPGHNKGIACVQYDGRRIVSGSSDNTVKIFDRSGAEVACLMGHKFLVRTVQAGFGDVMGSEDDDRAEARAVDQTFFEAHETGKIDLDAGPKSNRSRNAGSKDPQKITAVGASLPPGGGGSRWGRIVSGSYDETIIIWKRDSEGKWVVGHRLQQEEAARAAGGNITRPLGIPAVGGGFYPLSAAHHLMFTGYAMGFTGPTGFQTGQAATNPTVTPAPDTSVNAVAHQMQQQFMNAAANSPLLQMAMNHQQRQQNQQTHQQIVPPPQDPYMNVGQMFPANSFPPGYSGFHHHHPSPPHPAPLGTHPIQGTIAPPPPPPPLPPPTAQQLQQQHQQQQQQQQQQHINNGNARVFKLQFDARRIICCSQDPKIVGWDFAMNDEEIIEASRFFHGL